MTAISDMRPMAEFVYDAATAISQGRRDQQEDAMIADFPVGAGLGFAVLADGMGGHAAGDIASKIVVTEVFSELKMQAGDPKSLEQNVETILRGAAHCANECVAQYGVNSPASAGMGATLLAPVIFKDRLYWISIGDSPLFLFRNGKLLRLNEDHSMTPQIDYLVSTGVMARQEAENHPDRNCLTSVLVGQAIPQIDCSSVPVQLLHDDIIIVASDGLQHLAEARIAHSVRRLSARSSAEISASLMQELEDLDDPDQDNISLCVIKVTKSMDACLPAPDPMYQDAMARPEILRRNRKAVMVLAMSPNADVTMACRVSMEKSA